MGSRLQVNKYTSNPQRGAVLLLLMLSLLLSGAGISLVSYSHEQHHQLAGNAGLSLAPASSPFYLRAERDMRALNKAKIALQAYAIAYADNYNPGGAGPGHLPCPDLDPPDDGRPGNDGPNPPCGNRLRQTGRVPRITTAQRSEVDDGLPAKELPDNRSKVLEFYPLHTFLDQQPWYTVAGDFINNPLNRRVNPSTRSALTDAYENELLAVVAAPGVALTASGQRRPGISAQSYLEYAGSNPTTALGQRLSRDRNPASNDLLTFLYKKHLMPLVQRRVAGFLKQQLIDYRQKACPLQRIGNSAAAHADTAMSARQRAGSAVQCFPPESQQPSNEASETTNTNWISSLATDELLQGVPLARHWLVRNEWHNEVNYRIDQACLEDTNHGCDVLAKIHEPAGSLESTRLEVAKIHLAVLAP